MKKLLVFGAPGFICAAFWDSLWSSGLNRPVSWIRDIIMVGIGLLCFYVLLKYRKQL